jgi:hypothetical protein
MTEMKATEHIYGPEFEGGQTVLLAAPGDPVTQEIADAYPEKVVNGDGSSVTVEKTVDTGIASTSRRAEIAAENEAIQERARLQDLENAGGAAFSKDPPPDAPDIAPGELQDAGQVSSTLADGAPVAPAPVDGTRDEMVSWYNDHVADEDAGVAPLAKNTKKSDAKAALDKHLGG